MTGTVATYGIRARSPIARSWDRGMDVRAALERHCAECGRGLSGRTRAALTVEDRLVLAVFGAGPLCDRCTPAVFARLAARR